jgi:GR25 family glycosyltransferase involved in LPS biosynthesis
MWYQAKEMKVTQMDLHVSCISLRERVDRRECVETLLRPHFPDLAVFDAVDVATVPLDVASRMKVMPRASAGARERKSACWASHVAVLTRAVVSDSFPLLVLEDDIYVPDAMVNVAFDSLPRDSICMIAGSFNAALVKDMGDFRRNRQASKLAGTMQHGINPLQKGDFRISSSAAYFVPTATVAVQLLAELRSKRSITHYDIDLFASPLVRNLWFPSPFATYQPTATTSDVMTSQTVLFSTNYVTVSKGVSRKRSREEK